MKRIFTLLAMALLLTLVGSCSKKSSNPSDDGNPTEKELQKIDSLMTTQAVLDTTLQGLFSQMDSTAAKDSLVKILRADPNVQQAQSSSQGISIQYTSGMRGGIFLDPKDGVESTDKMGEMLSQSHGSVDASGRKPVSKRTKFLNPSYWERSQWAIPLLAAADAAFPKAGFNIFERLVNGGCTVDEFASLSGYGIVHIYSHGWAWPNDHNIQEVYLLTGEAVTQATNTKYLADIQKGKIILGVNHGANRYWISPSFFAAHNDFHDDTTLVYLGFCYSFLGGWKDTLTQIAGAGACVGFSWHVQTNWNAAWARHLYKQMCDTSLAKPMTVYQWWYAESDTDNTYWDNEPQCQKDVYVSSRGYDDLVLWSMVKIASINPDSGAADIPVTIRGSGFGYQQGTSTVTFGGIAATVNEWSDTLIVAQVPFEATSGDVIVTVGSEASNAIHYQVTDPSHTLVPLTSQYSMKIYGPYNQWEFEFVFDLAFSGSIEGPGLATVSETTVWPYPETEPMNRSKSYYGTVGGPSPADVTVGYSLQSTVNGQDASFSTPITLTKTYESGDYWEVTVTPIYLTGQWKDSDSQYPLVQVAEATPIVLPVVAGDRSHLIISRRFDLHAVLHHHVGIDYTYDYWPIYSIAGFTFEHR
jgi:hypothetical protein